MNGKTEHNWEKILISRVVPFLHVHGVVSFPWWMLIETVLSSPSGFIRFAFGVDSSRLVIASATSRWHWLSKGLLCEIAYFRELFPWVRDTFFNSMSRSSPLLAVPSLTRVPSKLLAPPCRIFFVGVVSHSLLLVASVGQCAPSNGLLMMSDCWYWALCS